MWVFTYTVASWRTQKQNREDIGNCCNWNNLASKPPFSPKLFVCMNQTKSRLEANATCLQPDVNLPRRPQGIKTHFTGPVFSLTPKATRLPAAPHLHPSCISTLHPSVVSSLHFNCTTFLILHIKLQQPLPPHHILSTP